MEFSVTMKLLKPQIDSLKDTSNDLDSYQMELISNIEEILNNFLIMTTPSKPPKGYKIYGVCERADVSIMHTVFARNKKEAVSLAKDGEIEKTEILEYLGDSFELTDVGLL